jgi:anti-sigma regulatory factor (Ser/Thr protein kinase)
MPRSIAIQITDQTRIGEARRMALELAQQLGFGRTEAGKLGIVVTEACTNLIKHASEGCVLLEPLEDQNEHGLEIRTLDKGPGMSDVSRCIADGYSTAGSPGHGLGAIARLSSLFDIYSLPGKGTVMVARLWARGAFRPASQLEIGAVCLPKDEQIECGDNWSVKNQPGRTLILVADGLGHGPLAAHAANEAERVFQTCKDQLPGEILRMAQGPLQSTRGASVAVAEINFIEGVVRYAGVGNISGTILDAQNTRSMISHGGTVGHEVRRVQELSYEFPRHSLLIMHSDGLGSRWSLGAYPGLMLRHPALIAGVLYRDFQRGRDDVTVIAARQQE